MMISGEEKPNKDSSLQANQSHIDRWITEYVHVPASATWPTLQDSVCKKTKKKNLKF
jgi:hypothetical protein